MRSAPPITRYWKGRTGTAHNAYKGYGPFKNRAGYLLYHFPDSRFGSGVKRVGVHQIVVMRAIGKDLRDKAPIHHVNEDKADNRNANLVVCDSDAYHALLHSRTRALDATGNANARRCSFCKKYDAPENLRFYMRKGQKMDTPYHAECNRLNARRYA